MERGLAFIQFIIVALGVTCLHLMVRLDARDHPSIIERLASFAAHHGLWFFAIPILWAIFATALRGKINRKVLQGLGVALTILLFIVFALPLTFYLR